MRLLETRPVGDVVLMRYAPCAPGTDDSPTAADRHWLALACALAADCPHSETAFSVGAVIVASDGTELARGHSREGGDPVVHAEEAALAKIGPADPGCAPPPSTAASNRAPDARPGPGPAPGSSSTRARGAW